MRLFAAIELDAGAREAIGREQARLRRYLDTDALRWIRPEQLHLTLVFIGEVADERGPAIVEAVSRDVPMPPFSVAFAGAGVFPPFGAPRGLWLGVTTGAEQVTALQQVVSSRLEALGFPPEPRGFRPHLTLGRWRVGRSRSAHDRLPAGDDRQPPVATLDVTEVTLFQSRVSSSGAEHTPLARAALQCLSSPSSPRT